MLDDQTFLGKAVLTDTEWLLYEVQGNYRFPALVKVGEMSEGYRVYGEFYYVNDGCLRVLDRLEGVGVGLYERIFVKVLLPDGRSVEEVVTYRFLQETSDCEPVGPVWPIAELSRYRLEGHRFCEADREVTRAGVALWNKRESDWATEAFEHTEALLAYCMPKRAKFGVRRNSNSPYSSRWFEVRPRNFTCTRKHIWMVTGDEQSPEFDTRDGLAEWAAEHRRFFGGIEGDASAWRRHLAEAVPIID